MSDQFDAMILRGGESLSLSTPPYHLMAIDGIGAAPATRIQEHLAQQHGVTDYGFYLGPRRIALSVGIEATDYATWHQRREALLSMLKAADTPVTLRIESGGQTRDIACYYSADLDMAPGQLATWQQATVELVAPDPLWHEPNDGVAYNPVGAGIAFLDVPVSIPLHVGTRQANVSFPIAYPGTWDAYPVIYIGGPIVGPTISNEALGLQLSLSTASIAAGDSYVIDCRWGYKTITRASDGSNRIFELDSSSDLTEFRIGAAPTPVGGLNSIRLAGTGAGPLTYIAIHYPILYVGV